MITTTTLSDRVQAMMITTTTLSHRVQASMITTTTLSNWVQAKMITMTSKQPNRTFPKLSKQFIVIGVNNVRFYCNFNYFMSIKLGPNAHSKEHTVYWHRTQVAHLVHISTISPPQSWFTYSFWPKYHIFAFQIYRALAKLSETAKSRQSNMTKRAIKLTKN